jgi:hypothetical protein
MSMDPNREPQQSDRSDPDPHQSEWSVPDPHQNERSDPDQQQNERKDPDPHQSERSYPDPHQFDREDPDPHHSERYGPDPHQSDAAPQHWDIVLTGYGTHSSNEQTTEFRRYISHIQYLLIRSFHGTVTDLYLIFISYLRVNLT